MFAYRFFDKHESAIVLIQQQRDHGNINFQKLRRYHFGEGTTFVCKLF